VTTEPEAPAVINAIVACGTCDSVFRAHEGRQTCPVCGGDPNLRIIDLQPTSEAAVDPSGRGEGPAASPPALGVDTPPPSETTPSEETRADAGKGGEAGADPDRQERASAAGRRRRRP
jgi:rubredoxin